MSSETPDESRSSERGGIAPTDEATRNGDAAGPPAAPAVSQLTTARPSPLSARVAARGAGRNIGLVVDIRRELLSSSSSQRGRSTSTSVASRDKTLEGGGTGGDRHTITMGGEQRPIQLAMCQSDADRLAALSLEVKHAALNSTARELRRRAKMAEVCREVSELHVQRAKYSFETSQRETNLPQSKRRGGQEAHKLYHVPPACRRHVLREIEQAQASWAPAPGKQRTAARTSNLSSTATAAASVLKSPQRLGDDIATIASSASRSPLGARQARAVA
mmetsp:Transcript_21482/g.61796  ORF Transcript_21482/g.61796 Transcript_21482/m.61796 type:complete len:276 (-) Transcript_21482:89-916(-)